MPNSRLVTSLARVIFFATGFSALAYQVVWHRMLTMFAGSDVRSATLVVAGFLAGLGIGSLLSRYFVDRLTPARALWVFGIANLVIAAYGSLSKLLFYDLLVQEGSWLAANPVTGFITILFALAVPTTLMGMSLPLLVRALVDKVTDAGRQISLLYGLNTLGSVCGALVAGWILVSAFGYEGTLYIASSISLLAGMASIVLVRRVAPGAAVAAGQKKRKPDVFRFFDWGPVVFLAGFTSISLEIVWFRVAGVMLFTTSYTFGHLLAFVLAGYGLGALFGGRLTRNRQPQRMFLTLVGGAILSGLAGLLLAYFAGPLYRNLLPLDPSIKGFIDFGLIPALLLLPANFFIGASFIALQSGIHTDSKSVGSRVGQLQAVSTVGNVLGSVVTGLFFLDLIGTTGSLIVLILIALLFGILCWVRYRDKTSAALVFMALILLISMPSNLDFWRRLHVYKLGEAQVDAVAEDSTGVSSLVSGSPPYIAVNAEVEGWFAYNRPADSTHTALGMLGALVHPNPQDILIIGIGSGRTPLAAGISPDTELIRAVEIVGSEIPILNGFRAENPDHPINVLFEDPRYQLVIGDGRKELILSEQKYDLIEADAIRPWKSGSGFLYSVEFFEAARDKLKIGGYMVQWPATERVRTTFHQVFPYVLEFADSAMIGSMTPIDLDLNLIVSRFASSDFGAQYAERLGIELDLEALIAQIMPGNPLLETEVNTDLYPKDETYLRDSSRETDLENTLELADEARLAKNFARAAVLYQRAAVLSPGDLLVLERLADAYKKSGQMEQAEQALLRWRLQLTEELSIWEARQALFVKNDFLELSERAENEIERLLAELQRVDRLLRQNQ